MSENVMNSSGFKLLSFPAIAQKDEEHVIESPFGTIIHRRKVGEALHPERESLEVLEGLRMEMGTLFFSAQYLQSPTPPGGGIVKIDWFNRYDPAKRPPFSRIIQSWDCASKSGQSTDFSVGTTWGETANKDIYLIHVFRERLDYPDLKRKARELAGQHGAKFVLIEDTSAGIQLIQELRREGFARIEAIKPEHTKITRMTIQTPVIEAGKVYVPNEAPWLADYLQELAMFPKARFDDQVDSTSQALDFIRGSTAMDNLARGLDALNSHQQGSSPGDPSSMNTVNWLDVYLKRRPK